MEYVLDITLRRLQVSGNMHENGEIVQVTDVNKHLAIIEVLLMKKTNGRKACFIAELYQRNTI